MWRDQWYFLRYRFWNSHIWYSIGWFIRVLLNGIRSLSLVHLLFHLGLVCQETTWDRHDPRVEIQFLVHITREGGLRLDRGSLVLRRAFIWTASYLLTKRRLGCLNLL